MTSLADLNKSINILQEKIDELINLLVTQEALEIASAKIIFETTKSISEKIQECPCNKDIIDEIKNISITNTASTSQDRRSYKGLTRFSPPSISKPETPENKTLSIKSFSDKA